MELLIEKPFFPYQKDYNIQNNGVQTPYMIICDSLSIFNDKILKINSPSGLYPENYLAVKNVNYTFEYQDISVTRDWKLYDKKDLKRIYKITFLIKDFSFQAFVKLNIWQEFRLKWFWKMFLIQKNDNLWRILNPIISGLVGIVTGWVLYKLTHNPC